jgi:EF hand
MKKLLATFAVIAFSAGAASAQMVEFSAVDTDANSMVTMEEASAAGLTWTAEEFAAADTDGDGSLNADEFKAATMK